MENKLQVFKHPLDIPRDELIRHLIYLPVQVATELDSHCARARGQTTSTMRTPLIRVLECHISKQDGLQESMPTGLLASGFTIQSTARDSQNEVLPSKKSSTSRPEERFSVYCDKEGLEMEQVKQGVNGVIDGSNKRKRDSGLQVKLKENPYNKASSEYNSSERESSPIVKMDIGKQTNFLISIIRILRNSKPNQSKELFDLLSSSNLPMKKEHLVEQLIWMAKEYNKKTLVEELMEYKNCNN